MTVCRTCGERHRLAECPICGEPGTITPSVTRMQIVIGTMVYFAICLLFLLGMM